MLHVAVLLVCLGFVNGVANQRTTSDPPDIIQTLDANVAPGHATLNEMFREVEKLMEDTQHKLEEAVHQMDNESAKSLLYAHNLPPNYHNASSTEGKERNQSIHTVEKIIKECMIDEDCEKGSYCLYEILSSKCLPCKAADAACEKDEECCAGHLCVWGRCSENSTRGEAGSICQYQSECSAEHCCAFHKDLLFPVCRPRPQEQQPCHDHPNLLMELLLWDLEGPAEHCPCSRGLQCQPLGRGSLCMDERNSSGEGAD